MEWKREWRALLLIAAGFLLCFYLPVEELRKSVPIDALRDGNRLRSAVWESLHLVRWYAREHVLLCLIPAFFIAGAIAVFISQASVIKYLGAGARKTTAYGVASVSGAVLAVCSCTVLPLFAGIYKMGAGVGPAAAFLYSGPAINVLAIILTARVLGLELGAARAVGAVSFSVVIGLLMHLIFMKEESEKAKAAMVLPGAQTGRPLWQNGLFFAALVAILVFANWGEPAGQSGLWHLIYSGRWLLTAGAATAMALMLFAWFGMTRRRLVVAAAPVVLLALFFPHEPLIPFGAGIVMVSLVIGTAGGEPGEWLTSTWGFTKQILPLLLLGVLAAGFLLGRPGEESLIPEEWVARSVGGNSLSANLFASVVGAFMYFATLTEVPILQGLIGSGMGKGPALALLLAGPALSLPNMIVIRSVMGTRKTAVFTALVVVMAAAAGMIYGAFF
jgi:hypothetical protein